MVEHVIGQYEETYRQYFAQRSLIPAGQLHEVSYEQLEKDPVGEMEQLYEALGWQKRWPEVSIEVGDNLSSP
jgi:LPS sulfotransferase NodH